jgi:hypothetical protein
MTDHLWIWRLVECPVCEVDKGVKCLHAQRATSRGYERGANAVCVSRYRVWDRRRKYWRDSDHGGLSGGILEKRLAYYRAARAERLAARSGQG